MNTLKKFKNGLCLMKGYPVHLGHCHLIKIAAAQCETVHVMICSLKRETIPGELRYHWLKEIFKDQPNINIIHVTDENPQYPNECETIDEFYNKYWVPTVYDRIKELDVVFTSEAYGDEFAEYLGIKHILVDQKRKKWNVSGTAVRKNAFDNWNLIPEPVQRYFKKKIVVLGPESCGKSTLVKKLANTFNCPYVEEYGRTYTNIIKTDMLSLWDFEVITINHERLVNRAFKENKKMLLFVDTEAIITKTFAKLYLEDKYFNSPLFNNVIRTQKYDLIILLEPTVQWIDDGTRDFPDKRYEHFNLIKQELDKFGLKYQTISETDYEKRFLKAINIVNEFLKNK